MSLRLSPWVYAKIRWLLAHSDTEIGGFGVARCAEDPLFIHDFVVLPQSSTMATVELDDMGIADFTEDMVAAGFQPFQFLRVWTHTHPGAGAEPSTVDTEMFRTKFGNCDWAAMLIVSKTGAMTCRLSVRIGAVRHEMNIPVEIEWPEAFPASDHAQWQEDLKKVRQEVFHDFMGELDLLEMRSDGRNTDKPVQPLSRDHKPRSNGKRNRDRRWFGRDRQAGGRPTGHDGGRNP